MLFDIIIVEYSCAALDSTFNAKILVCMGLTDRTICTSKNDWQMRLNELFDFSLRSKFFKLNNRRNCFLDSKGQEKNCCGHVP